MAEYKIPQHLQRLHHDIREDQLRYHRKRTAITKDFTFDAAHHLHHYEGKCKNLHGHTYRVVMTVSGYVDEIGMIMDFSELKSIYRTAVHDQVDHQYLNEVLPPMNSTAENMVVWIWERIETELNRRGHITNGCRLEELHLYETPSSCASLKREWMNDHD